eukprot:TRINITY_DN19403_c0_g2_i1.p1 TRINITY_DN19403_c0_g2~~TRINITY_DN19403_c0_g2_i1.p1  ORF type:complete len:262 (+),score=32.76 TRINITY_DN19403_c0_g2_i1:174-959(+)
MAYSSFCHTHALQAFSFREGYVSSGCSMSHSTASARPLRTCLSQPLGLPSSSMQKRGFLRMDHNTVPPFARDVNAADGMQARSESAEETTEAHAAGLWKPAVPYVAALGSWGLGMILSVAALGFSVPPANADFTTASMLLMPGTTGIGGPQADDGLRSREKEFIVTFQNATPSSVVEAICYEAALGDLGSSFSGECVETKFTDRGNFLLINISEEDMETLMEVHSTHIASVVPNQPIWLDEATEVYCGPFYGTECKTQGYL